MIEPPPQEGMEQKRGPVPEGTGREKNDYLEANSYEYQHET
jgi:hypothetical protein